MSMEIVNGDGKYDIDVAAKPLLDSVAKTGADHNDADVVKIQVDALRRCGVRNRKYKSKFNSKMYTKKEATP